MYRTDMDQRGYYTLPDDQSSYGSSPTPPVNRAQVRNPMPVQNPMPVDNLMQARYPVRFSNSVQAPPPARRKGPVPFQQRGQAFGSLVARRVWNIVLISVVWTFDVASANILTTHLPGSWFSNFGLFTGIAGASVVSVMLHSRRTKADIAFKVSVVLALVLPLSPLGCVVTLQHYLRQSSMKRGVIAVLVATVSVVVFCLKDASLPYGEGIFDVTSAETGQLSVFGVVHYVLMAAFMLVIPVLLGIIQRFRGHVETLSQVTDELHGATDDLKVELTRSQEREVIAREIHDTVSHHIARVAMQANLGEMRASDPESAKLFQDIRETSQGSMEDMRTLIHSLRDSASEGYIGVTPIDLNAVRLLVSNLRNDGVNLNAAISIDPGFSTSSVAASATFRIVREGLTNAVKYSRESHILLSLSAIHGVGIFVEITNTTDPSKQSESSTTGTGSGLLGMAERASQLGGYLNSSETEGIWRLRSFLPVTDRKSEKR